MERRDPFLETLVDAFVAYSSLEQPEYTCRESKGHRPNMSDVKKYVSSDVFGYVASHEWTKQMFEYTFDDVGVRLVVWATPGNRLAITMLIKIFNYLIFALNKVSGKQLAPRLVDVTIVCCDLPKTFPESDGVVLDQKHINSGYTEKYGPQSRRIVIYRVEELVKVLLHELIHLYDIDFHVYPFQYDDAFMRKYRLGVRQPWKNQRNPLALYESYTETLASYGNVIVHTLFCMKRTMKTRTDIVSGVRERFRRELKFYTMQVRRILWFAKKNGGHVEDSHVFSYYVVKCAMFKRFDNFLEFIDGGVRIGRRIDAYLALVDKVVQDTDIMNTSVAGVRKPYKATARMTNINWPDLVLKTKPTASKRI
jgi:hypothetical protein